LGEKPSSVKKKKALAQKSHHQAIEMAAKIKKSGIQYLLIMK
jgi:hypothetical protein